MTISDRRQRERDELRVAILDAARELFASEGYEGVTMRKVAEKIEYSPTLIYKLFPNKPILVLELCYADYRALARRMSNVVEVTDPIQRLRGIAQIYLRFAQEFPNHYRFMFLLGHPIS